MTGSNSAPYADRSPRAAALDVAWWTSALFGLTGVALAWLTVTGVNPAEHFSPAILLAGYAPLLAALLISAVRGGASEVGILLRQVLTWRWSADPRTGSWPPLSRCWGHPSAHSPVR